MFNWFKVLWNIKDQDLVQLNGVDYTLYLVYLRYAATLFAAITLFNCLVMMPVYASGDPTVNQFMNYTESTLNDVTVLNITAS